MTPLRSLHWITLGVGMTLGAPACSSPKEPGHCPDFAHCGGELVGRWDATSFCVAGNKAEQANDAQSVPECKALYLSVLYQSVVSSLDFSEGATSLGGTVAYGSKTELELTNGCSLALLGSDVSPEVCQLFTEQLASDGWDVPVNCSGSGVCYCNSSVTYGPMSVLYDRAAGKLLSASGEEISYCLKGDSLKVKDRSQGIDILINYVRSDSVGT